MWRILGEEIKLLDHTALISIILFFDNLISKSYSNSIKLPNNNTKWHTILNRLLKIIQFQNFLLNILYREFRVEDQVIEPHPAIVSGAL